MPAINSSTRKPRPGEMFAVHSNAVASSDDTDSDTDNAPLVSIVAHAHLSAHVQSQSATPTASLLSQIDVPVDAAACSLDFEAMSSKEVPAQSGTRRSADMKKVLPIVSSLACSAVNQK
jgi:hypothetical protein